MQVQVKQNWEKEFSLELSDEDWRGIWETQIKTTSSRAWWELSWKNLIRFIITPTLKSVHQGRENLGVCWRQCGNTVADYFHIFWACPSIHPYWQEIIKELKNIFDLEIDFLTLYLGKFPDQLSTSDQYRYKILLVASKKAIARKWLQAAPPTKDDWIMVINETDTMERLA